MNGRIDAELHALIDVYRAETAENLAAMEHGLLALEKRGDADAELLHAVLRGAHTIKGSSATIGYTAVANSAHEMEDTLQRVREGTLAWNSGVAARLMESLDALRLLTLAPPNAAGVEDTEATPAAIRRTTGRETSLRVNLSRLDRLLDLTAEITIARGRMAQLVGASAGSDDVLGGTLWQLEQLHAALHSEVMMLRMVRLGPVFRAQQRTARDVAQHRGKLVHLVVEGDDVEVDTSISEQLRDPLTHMIRNSVDHGIESPAERVAAGKPRTGKIVLRAQHQAGTVVIEIEDDGRGLDREKIAARAEALGLLDNAAALSDDQLFACIFEPGFSTAGEITTVSGRGVGMDVVRRHIRALRGTIDISSLPGRGTRFVIRLPLTVAIINGLLVAADGERYVVPMEAVEECVDFQSAQAHGAEAGVLNLRGKPVPYTHLAGSLGGSSARSARACVVILRQGHMRVGLVVDSLDGDCQAVIKPLSGMLQHLRGIAGSTILGDGRVALILDVPQLVELITKNDTMRAVA
jgi:two-component system chemotaxis sensor kinase CheA